MLSRNSSLNLLVKIAYSLLIATVVMPNFSVSRLFFWSKYRLSGVKESADYEFLLMYIRY